MVETAAVAVKWTGFANDEVRDLSRQFDEQASTLLPVEVEALPNPKSWSVELIASSALTLSEAPHATLLGGVRPGEFPASAVAWLCSHYAAITREQSGIYTLRAAAVRGRNGAIILCGPPRSGKTTVALILARRGFEVLSSNLTICQLRDGEAYVVGGTRVFTARSVASKALWASGYRLLPDDVDPFALTRVGGIEASVLSPIRVTSFYFLTSWPEFARRSDCSEVPIQLFSALSELPRTSVIFDENTQSWPFDSPALARRRSAFATRLAETLRPVDVAGPATQIAAFVEKADVDI